MSNRTIANAACLALALVVDIAFPGHNCVVGVLTTIGMLHIGNAAFPRPESDEFEPIPEPALLGRFRARILARRG